MEEKPVNMFDVLHDVGRMMQETAQTLGGVQKTLNDVVEIQRSNGEKFKEISALVATANEATARADVHLMRAREILAGHVPIVTHELSPPTEVPELPDEYLTRRSEDAIAAGERVGLIVADSAAHIADLAWMTSALVRIRAEHLIVRNWLDEAVYDEPLSQEAAVVVRRNMDRLESTFESDIECAATLAPFKDAFAETAQRMSEIIARSTPDGRRS